MLKVAPDYWAVVNEALAKALGLPPRREGYGLLMFEGRLNYRAVQRFTWAGDSAVVAAMGEHNRHLDSDAGFVLEAAGWPETGEDGQPVPMLWRPRTTLAGPHEA